MNPKSLPVIGSIFEMGADDTVFDGLLLVGPILLVLIALGGRHASIVALVGLYLLVFLSKVSVNFLRAD